MMIVLIKRFKTKSEQWKTERIRRWYLNYQGTIKKIRYVLKGKYGMIGVTNNEFKHFLSFFKYNPATNSFFIINVHGTREEIDKLQEDPDLKQSVLSN